MRLCEGKFMPEEISLMLKSVLRSRLLISITTNTETHWPTVRPLTFLMSCDRYLGVSCS